MSWSKTKVMHQQRSWRLYIAKEKSEKPEKKNVERALSSKITIEYYFFIQIPPSSLSLQPPRTKTKAIKKTIIK